MKERVGLIALAAALAAGCNPKSPEQTAEASEAEPQTIPAAAVAEPEAEEDEPAPDPDEMTGPTFVAFDLLANRPLAHTREASDDGRGAYVAQMHRPSGNRYIAGDHADDWTLTEVEERAVLALRKTRKTLLWLPSPTDEAGVMDAEVYNPANRANELVATFNGEKLPAATVEPGWQTVRLNIPATAMRYENEIEIEFSSMGRIGGDLSGGGVRTIRLGAPVGRSLEESVDVAAEQGPLTIGPHDGGAAWTLWSLPDSKIRLELEGEEGCTVDAVAHTERGGSLAEAARKRLGTGTAWFDAKVSRELIRLELVPHEKSCDAGVTIRSAGLVLPGEAPRVPEAEPPRYVLFWMIDTLRADHLPIHFETVVQAPNLVRLAAEGASFKLAYVQGNESRASHASLFSGMYPNRHRVLARGHLKPFHYLLPEAIQELDRKTYAFISNGYVSKPWGFVQGWDMYRNNLREGFGIDGQAMAKHSLDWAKRHKDHPFFLYVGTIDPHVTYRAHDEFIGLYDDPDYSGRYRRSMPGTTLGEVATKKVTLTEREQQRVKALYKNEISYNDKAFGDLRAGLEELGIWDQTMVVITGDHGEHFWEHGLVGHGSGVAQQVVHVPLIFYYPPLIPGGTVVEAGADSVDVYPTILEALGATELHEDVQGHSLLPHIHKVRGDYPEPAIATHYTQRYGIQLQHWKLIVKKGSYELFDRKTDPQELEDVKGKHPLAERWLHDVFGVFRPHRHVWRKSVFGPPSNLHASYLESLRSALESAE